MARFQLSTGLLLKATNGTEDLSHPLLSVGKQVQNLDDVTSCLEASDFLNVVLSNSPSLVLSGLTLVNPLHVAIVAEVAHLNRLLPLLTCHDEVFSELVVKTGVQDLN